MSQNQGAECITILARSSKFASLNGGDSELGQIKNDFKEPEDGFWD